MTRKVALTTFGIAIFSLTACGAGAEDVDEAEQMETWTVGVLPCGTACGYLDMASEQGFYEDYGVDVEFVELSAADQVYTALVAGEVDAIQQSPGGLLIGAEEAGMEGTIIGSSMDGLPYAIYSGSDFETIEDLEGQSVAVSAATGLPYLVAEQIFLESGIDFDGMQHVNAGGNEDRYLAVVAGTADAASSPADYIPRAEDDDVNVVALSSEIIPDYPRYMIIGNNDSLEERPEAAARFLAALSAGMRYAYDNPEEAVALTAEHMEVEPDDEMVTYMNELIADEELVNQDAAIDMNKLEYMQEVLIATGQITGEIELEDLVDFSYHERAMELLEEDE